MATIPQPASSAQPQVPEEIYVTLTGGIDAGIVQRVFNAGAVVTTGKVKRVHLLIHSTGGVISDGIALYNYLRRLPIELTTYCAGCIASAAVLVYLAGKTRKTSNGGIFVLHKAQIVPASATAEGMRLASDSLLIEDARNESILREHVNLPQEKWEIQARGNLVVTAQEAVQFGLAHAIGDWAPPFGANVTSLVPPTM